jgi:hypothetical protein
MSSPMQMQSTNSRSTRPCRFQGAFSRRELTGSCCWKPTLPLKSFKFTTQTDPHCTPILTNKVERPKPTDNTAITFADPGSMQPETRVTWFYPGYTSGHEFVYSNREEQELAQVKRRTVMASPQDKHQIQTVAAGD